MGVRNIVLLLLCITVVAPIVLYTDRLGSFESSPSTKQEFIEDVTVLPLSTADSGHLNLLPQETSTVLKEPIGVVYTNEDSINRRNLPRGLELAKTREHVSARVLSATTKEDQAEKDATIKLVTDEIKQGNQGGEGTLEKADATGENVNGEDAIDVDDNDGKLAKSSHDSTQEPLVKGTMLEQQQTTEISSGINKRRPETNKQNDQMPSDARVQQLKDQLIQAKVYLSLPVVKSNPHLTRELRLRVKEVTRTLGEATKDADLPRK